MAYSKIAKTLKNNDVSVTKVVTPFGKTSSISPGGKQINVQNVAKGEIRGLNNVQPYGISSCGLDGLYAQTAVSDNNNNVVIGVYDPNKPAVGAGSIVIYSVGGSTISVAANNSITTNAKGAGSISMGAPDPESGIEGEAGVQIHCDLGESKLALDESGNIELSNPTASIKVATDGTIDITNPGATISISVSGEVTITANAGINITANGDINLDPSGKANYKGDEIETK